MPTLSSQRIEDYQTLTMVFQDILGVMITDDQHASVLDKLNRVIQAFEMDSIKELADKMRRPNQQRLNSDVLDAITTAGSRWFEHTTVSHLLRNYVLNNIGTEAKLWVAGCGDGMLAYSVAIDVAEYNLTADPKNVSIAATDIFSNDIDDVAKGCFRASYVGDNNQKLLSNYLLKRDDLNDAYGDPSGDILEVKPQIRNMIEFTHCDLLEGCDDIGLVDVIICPDILVYFSNTVRDKIIEQFSSALKPGGILLVAEDQAIMSDSFERVDHSDGTFYRLKN